ncbi:MAG: hypothetical protein Q4G30_06745 [Actinomycetaceae bacterium]|nr:hypothetical protein [Actinomycetaceae bacterium]
MPLTGNDDNIFQGIHLTFGGILVDDGIHPWPIRSVKLSDYNPADIAGIWAHAEEVLPQYGLSKQNIVAVTLFANEDGSLHYDLVTDSLEGIAIKDDIQPKA